jgi:REP element-mobilizing transposase RayT
LGNNPRRRDHARDNCVYRRRIARAPRLEIPGGTYHVFARGNERRPIYRDDTDRERFLEALGTTLDGRSWSLFAFCLMTNHYHLLLRTADADLSTGMHDLNAVYAQRFNRRHDRVGHLFQGRFGARLVQDGPRFLWAARYVARNPREAGRRERPRERRWNSHWQVLGLTPPWKVDTRALLEIFHPDRERARALYRDYVDLACPGEGDRDADPRHPLIDGDDSFIAEHLARIVPAPAYPKHLLAPPRPTLVELLGACPTTTELAAAHAAGYSLRVIGEHLGLDKSTISRRLRGSATIET